MTFATVSLRRRGVSRMGVTDARRWLAGAVLIVAAIPLFGRSDIRADAASGRAQDERAGDLAPSVKALGAATLTSIQVAGNGSDYVVGQSYDASSPWPRFAMPSFTMTIDFAQPAIRVERTRTQGEQPPRGGALQPLVGEQRLVQLLAGTAVWNETNGR